MPKKYKKPKAYIGASLPMELIVKLHEHCEETSKVKSHVVEEALRKYLIK